MCLLPGVIGFIFFIFFDLNKIYWKTKLLNLFFVLGSLLLFFSTGYCIWQSNFQMLFSHFGLRSILLLLGVILSGALLIYALFFALPFDDTYIQSEELPLVNKGLYGTCRHPGFWMFALFYLVLALFLSNRLVFICFVVYSICNFLYIVIQDKYIFPKYIHGYDEYKQNVPFLIPTRESIRNAYTD